MKIPQKARRGAARRFRRLPLGIKRHSLLLPLFAMSAAKPPFDSIRDLIASMPEASEASRQTVRARQAELTKPLGSLGLLEEIVAFLAAWQGKREPSIDRPLVAVFAGNHGVVETGLLLRRKPNTTEFSGHLRWFMLDYPA
jgi:hypothetical protein